MTLRRGTRVQLYRNLNKSRGFNVWSLTAAKAKRCGASRGQLQGHVSGVILSDCCFVVSESGRQRVLSRGHKEVHAWVEGVVDDFWPEGALEPDVTPWDAIEGDVAMIPITYNPRKYAEFRRTDTGAKIRSADVVVATPAGIVAFATGLRGLGRHRLTYDHPDTWNG